MKFGRINLSKTNYKLSSNAVLLANPPVDKLQKIYSNYCEYKKFESVMPMFTSQFLDINSDVFGYFDDHHELVAFSVVKKYDSTNAESVQFAWDYRNPKLRLGIVSLEHECAYYKEQGFEYLYLGVANEYKQQLNGFEFLGPA